MHDHLMQTREDLDAYAAFLAEEYEERVARGSWATGSPNGLDEQHRRTTVGVEGEGG